MTDAETLKKVIELGIERGFEPLDVDTVVEDCLFRLGGWHLNQILYDQRFARCYFGEEWPELMKDVVPANVSSVTDKPAYLYHLQQLVLLPTDSERILYYWNNRGEK